MGVRIEGMRKSLVFAMILTGGSSLVSQIVLTRELLTVFYGNEIAIGVLMASWLFWVSAGSLILGRFLAGIARGNAEALTGYFALIEVLLAALVPASLLTARSIPVLFGFLAGEIVGVVPMILSSFAVAAPICVLGGSLFVVGCEIYRVVSGDTQPVARVYVLEALGAALGGFIASFFLIRLFHPIEICAAVAAMHLFAAFLLLKGRPIARSFVAALLGGALCIAFSGALDTVRDASLRRQWTGFELIASENSIYGNVAVTKREDSYSLFTNGLLDFTVPDRPAAEPAAHFPLLEHPDPERVLLIGGGSGDILREVLKHPVSRVDYVELDPLVIRVSKDLLPDNPSLADPRVRALSDIDGRRFIKETAERYDVIIVNLPEPHNAQVNRFYTEEFYRESSRALTEDGILSFSMYSNPNYVSVEQADLYTTLLNTLTKVFADVVVTPGETNYFLASKKSGSLTLDWKVLTGRLADRGIDALYMRDYYLSSELSEGRIDFFRDTLGRSAVRAVNTDFRPIAYYYDLVLWSTYFSQNMKSFFKALDQRSIVLISAGVFLLIVSPIAVRPAAGNAALSWPILICVGSTGFAELAFQVVTLIAYQVLYGYVFYKLGVILTSFMVGLIAGGWLIARIIERGGGDYGLLIKTQMIIVVYPLVLPVVFYACSLFKGGTSFWIGSNLLPFVPVIPGVIGGFQFPLANKLFMEARKGSVAGSAAVTYGADLFGSCIGALIVSIFFIPIIGITLTCCVVAAFNLAGLILLAAFRSKRTVSYAGAGSL
ncbi:MAG: hypothetical protein ABIJ27_08095 [Candidatus Omnitrophota bacterium]